MEEGNLFKLISIQQLPNNQIFKKLGLCLNINGVKCEGTSYTEQLSNFSGK